MSRITHKEAKENHNILMDILTCNTKDEELKYKALKVIEKYILEQEIQEKLLDLNKELVKLLNNHESVYATNRGEYDRYKKIWLKIKELESL